MTDSDMNRYQDVLDFWFGTLQKNGLADSPYLKRWFVSDMDFDQQIKNLFESDVTQALTGNLNGWANHPASALALIVLLDQFCRNIYRGSAQAFAGDRLSLQLSRQLIESGKIQSLPAAFRFFGYMPLMHSENLVNHALLADCIAREISASSEPDLIQFWQGMNKSALEHGDILQRFGRYPHRNQVLHRESSDEETEYLNQSTSRFGQ